MTRWIASYRADIGRYTSHGGGTLRNLLTNQGLWALLQYRIASDIHHGLVGAPFRRPLLAVMAVWRKLVEVVTGICLPKEATIGPGLYIGHFGGIIIHPDTVIGSNCNIAQGVTIGVSGQGKRRGVPIVGNDVRIGAHAVLVGKITVGDGAYIGANSLVNRDVDPYTTVVGVPATQIGESRQST